MKDEDRYSESTAGLLSRRPKTPKPTSAAEVPYNLLSLHPMPAGNKIWNRRRVCLKVCSTEYTCVPFYKPISRPFKLAWPVTVRSQPDEP